MHQYQFRKKHKTVHSWNVSISSSAQNSSYNRNYINYMFVLINFTRVLTSCVPITSSGYPKKRSRRYTYSLVLLQYLLFWSHRKRQFLHVNEHKRGGWSVRHSLVLSSFWLSNFTRVSHHFQCRISFLLIAQILCNSGRGYQSKS